MKIRYKKSCILGIYYLEPAMHLQIKRIFLDADADSYIVMISPKEEGDQTDYARLFSIG